jgi:hypothetical protein
VSASSLPEREVAGFETLRAGSHGGVHVLTDVLDLWTCEGMARSFDANRHLAPAMSAPHEHFSGRTLWVHALGQPVADLARALSVRLAVKLRELFAEPDELADDVPQVSIWPAPHGMYWHQDTYPSERAYTAITYLAASPDIEAGETAFRTQRIMVPPVPGSSVLFDATQWHGVHDVRQGSRHALTCWYRRLP